MLTKDIFLLNQIYPDEYEEGHLPRIEYGKELIKKYCDINETSSVIELGSGLPFFTIDLPCLKICKDIRTKKDILVDNIFLTYCNLNVDDLGLERYDLIVMSEIWEHLPCNLYNLLERVKNSLKQNGFILSSFPIGGVTGDLDKELVIQMYENKKNSKKWADNHLREFNQELINEFMDCFDFIDGKICVCPSYGNIYVGLWRKK